MTRDALFPDDAPARPLWLVTLADLSLLLVGFFVLMQAQPDLDPRALARGMADGFRADGGAAALSAATPAPTPIAIDLRTAGTFGTGSAALSTLSPDLIEWAAAAARDPRVAFTITGATDGTATDVDPATGSATVLAADRARAVMVALATAGVPVARSTITIAPASRRRTATVTLAFVGEEGNRK